MLLSSWWEVCVLFICVHTWVCFCFLCIFNIFRTPCMTGRNEAKNLTLNSRKGSLLPLYLVQKYLFSNTSGVKMLWAAVCHLWNACFWNYRTSMELPAGTGASFHAMWAGCFGTCHHQKNLPSSVGPECQWIPFSVQLKTPNYFSEWETRNWWFLVMMIIFVK